jgi:hypothetical protein
MNTTQQPNADLLNLHAGKVIFRFEDDANPIQNLNQPLLYNSNQYYLKFSSIKMMKSQSVSNQNYFQRDFIKNELTP